MNSFIVHRVTVGYRAMFRCAECGRGQVGDARTVEAASVQEAEHQLRPQPHDMPVGWASYGRDVYRCPEHLR